MTFFRYIAVQLVVYCLDMGAFLTLTNVARLDAILANVFAKIIAGLFAFSAHRAFTFQSTGDSGASRQAVSYFLLLLANLPLSSVILYLLSKLISQLVLAKFLADAIGVFLTYWLSKTFVFTRRS